MLVNSPLSSHKGQGPVVAAKKLPEFAPVPVVYSRGCVTSVSLLVFPDWFAGKRQPLNRDLSSKLA